MHKAIITKPFRQYRPLLCVFKSSIIVLAFPQTVHIFSPMHFVVSLGKMKKRNQHVDNRHFSLDHTVTRTTAALWQLEFVVRMLQDMCRVSFLIIRIPITFNPRSPDEPGSQIRLRECKENCNDENETRVYDTRTCATESPCYTLPVPHCDAWTEWGECRGTTAKCQDPRKTRTQSCVGRLIVTPILVR